jgi:hypothetical protein
MLSILSVTTWIKGNPVRIGIWEIPNFTGYDIRMFAYWNGLWWGYPSLTPQGAFNLRFEKAKSPELFRGLSNKPAR